MKNKSKVCRFDQEYPKRLQEIIDPPAELYIEGTLPEEAHPSVGIVGARMCSHYGRSQAFLFAKVLAAYGVSIISGMAKGIDSAAHAGALEAGGKTFAVLGCGVDVCYPWENRNLYENIKKTGGILSEFPNQTKPLPFHFPKRNRIISGLSDIIRVVEAKEKSGSLITVDCALEQGKTVFAVPGRVDDPLSQGCNRLIAQGAGIAVSPESILEELHIDTVKSMKNNSKKNTNSGIKLASKLNLVYSCLDLQPKNVDTLLCQLPYSISELMGILCELQIEGLVVETAKNYYARKL